MSNAGADAPSGQSPPTDDLLEIYCRTGAAADFERVVMRYAAIVFAETRRVTRDVHDAEDAAQLAFLALAIELRSGTTIKQPAGWLRRVAKRKALKIVRSHGRRKKREDAARKPEAAPVAVAQDTDAIRQATAAAIRDAIDALPDKHRLPLVLHYFGGMTLETIAREMNLSRTAVGTRLHRARKILGTTLGERGIVFDEAALGGWISVLVPAAVLASIARATSASTGAAGSSAAISHGVGGILAAAGTFIGTRPVAAAAAAVLGISASGFAWIGPARLMPAVRQTFYLKQWLDRLLDEPPTFSLPQIGDTPIRLSSAEPAKSYAVPAWSMESATRVAVTSIVSTPTTPADNVVARADAHPKINASSPRQVSAAMPISAAMPMPMLLAPSNPPRDDSPQALTSSSFPPSSDTHALQVGSPRSQSFDIEEGQTPRFDSIAIGEAFADVGTIMQRGGVVTTDTLVVGDRGRGDYALLGGELNAGSVSIAVHSRSHGTLNIGGGELHVINPSTPIRVGQGGTGKLLLGTANVPGLLTTATGADVPLIVRETASAQGLVQGWGEVDARGTLVNNGRVIADGFDHLRALNLSQVSSVTNLIDNTPDGTNGWYARRGGRVVLPATRLSPGTHTYTWGESDDDPTLDLVNSLRFTAHDQPATSTAASVAISLRTIALADPLDVTLPTGVGIFGLWQLDGSGFDPKKLDVQIRYDHIAANGLFPGEFATRLIGYEDGEWRIATGESIDLADHIVSGSFDGAVSYLAVGMFWDDPFQTRLPHSLVPEMAYAMSLPSITPEPAALVALGLGLFALLPRRRTR